MYNSDIKTKQKGNNMENLKLDNGNILNRDFGKYRSRLVIISDKKIDRLSDLDFYKNTIEDWTKENKSREEFVKNTNIPFNGKIMSVIKGQFRINAKGTKIFDTTKKGDVLISIDWGGSFNKSRGIEIDKVKDYKYFHHAKSNGGGTGLDWIVVPENYKNELSIDDI